MDKTVKRSMLGLIEALEAQPHRPGPKTWQEFEDHVQHVYQTLLRLEGQTIMVAKDVCLVGSKGDEYQIDVYYEFEVAGLRHRVAIECKNRSRPIERDDVIAFNGKIRDCLDVRGVIVTANGFQSGARKHPWENFSGCSSVTTPFRTRRPSALRSGPSST